MKLGVDYLGAPQAGETETVVEWYRRKEFERKHRKLLTPFMLIISDSLMSFHQCNLETVSR